jgi:hypothetical protein
MVPVARRRRDRPPGWYQREVWPRRVPVGRQRRAADTSVAYPLGVEGVSIDDQVVTTRRRGDRVLDRAGLRRLVHLPVAVLIGAYVLWFGHLSVAVHDGYGTPGYDMGIFDQGVWLLSRFHAPFVTVMGRNLFGDHTSFILLLAVPLYWIWPHAQTLLVQRRS